MKSKYISLLLIFLCSFFQSCEDYCDESVTYLRYTPIYQPYDEIEAEIKFEAPRELKSSGKIYLYGQYLLINEPNKGIHFFDNQNPSNPVNLGFLNLPGNVDMAIKNNLLYADSYVDLLTYDLSNITQPQLIKRTREVFPYNNNPSVTTLGVIIGWEETEITESVDCSTMTNAEILWAVDALGNMQSATGTPSMFTTNSLPSVTNNIGNTTGTGGSMARFALAGDYLYTVDQSRLRAFDLSDPKNPVNVSNPQVDAWGIETIFHYNDALFIGAQNGMHIYSISLPHYPTKLSSFVHVQSCDPVVVQGDYAYVTLRGGNNCGGNSNQLDVIDISNLRSPKLHKTYQMDSPFGLGIDGSQLFICEGPYGLKYFDAADVDNITLLNQFPDMAAYDVIPYNNVLIMIGQDGLAQYDYSNPAALSLLSTIPIHHD